MSQPVHSPAMLIRTPSRPGTDGPFKSSFHSQFAKRPEVKTKAVKPKTPSSTTNSASRTTAPMFPDQILENLYISDIDTARAVLSPHYAGPGRPKIKYILSVLEDPKQQPKVEETRTTDFVLKLVRLNDWENVNLIEHLPEAHRFIKSSLANKDGGVLVHCKQGISRSGSIVIAYVMQELDLKYDEALKFVRQNRSKIWPNEGFAKQLQLWSDLEYSLSDPEGLEKAVYAQWKNDSNLKASIGRQ